MIPFGALLAGAPGSFQEAQDKAMKHALEMQRLRMEQQKIGQEQMGDAVYGRWLQSFGQQGPSSTTASSPAEGPQPPQGVPPVAPQPQPAMPFPNRAPGVTPPQPPSMLGPPGLPGGAGSGIGLQQGTPVPQAGSPLMRPQPSAMQAPGFSTQDPTTSMQRPPAPPPAALPTTPGPPARRDTSIGAGPGQGQLTLRELIQGLTRANPGAPPQAIAAGVTRALPMMRIDEQELWHQQQQYQKDRDRLEKQYQFDQKQLDVQQKFADRRWEIEQRMAQAKDETERKRIKDELDHTDRQEKIELGYVESARKLYAGEERVGVQREAIGQRERAATTRAETAREGHDVQLSIAKTRAMTAEEAEKGRMERARAAEEGKTERLGTTEAGKAERLGVTEAGKTERAVSKEQFERDKMAFKREDQKILEAAKQNNRLDLAYLKANLTQEGQQTLERMRQQGKMDYLGEAQKGRLQIEEKKEAAAEIRSARQSADRAATLKQQAELAQARGDERAAHEANLKAHWEQQASVSLARLEQSRQKYLPTTQEIIAQAEQSGFSAPLLLDMAKYQNMTGEPHPRMKGLSRQDASTVTKAMNAIATEENLTPEQQATNAAIWKGKQGAVKQILNPNSSFGQATRSLSVIQEHLKTWEEAVHAWNPGDTRLFNKVAAYFSSQTGSPLANNVDTIGRVVATEIFKALGVRGAGTGQEREELGAKFQASGMEAKGIYDAAIKLAQNGGGVTKEEAYGLIESMEKLVNGQLVGLKGQADLVLPTGMFETMLSPTAREEMQRIKEGRPMPRQLPVTRSTRSPFDTPNVPGSQWFRGMNVPGIYRQ